MNKERKEESRRAGRTWGIYQESKEGLIVIDSKEEGCICILTTLKTDDVNRAEAVIKKVEGK